MGHRRRENGARHVEARELLLQAEQQRPHQPDMLRNLLGGERRLVLEAESVKRIAAAAALAPLPPCILLANVCLPRFTR